MEPYKSKFQENSQSAEEIYGKIQDLFYADNGKYLAATNHFSKVRPTAIKIIESLLKSGVKFDDELLETFVMGDSLDIDKIYENEELFERLADVLFTELF
jgi:hypothetical protein